MKRLLTIFIIFGIYACSPGGKEELGQERKDLATSKPKEKDVFAEFDADSIAENEERSVILDSLEIESIFNSDYIKSKTSKLSSVISVDFESKNKQNFIPNEFVSQILTPHKIDIGYPENLHPDYPKAYSFKEFKEFSDFDLFTFTHDDESCCRTLYAATTKKDTLEIISIGVIGYTGGDGGWTGEQFGTWINDSILKTTIVSDYDEDLIDNNNSEIDSIWTVIKLNQYGYLQEIRIDSVKYIGDKKIG